ncbi:MAG TPA: BrnT family toxin [Blastocatellia bacterium]|nr:BrnT family toxin [Blastocatellia bacterium]
MPLTFEWDEQKAEQNLEKHGVSFAEASEVFSDPLSATIPDVTHSEEENRLLALGQSAHGRTLLVVFTERGERIRIISARLATRHEVRIYEEGED